jgi:hypothetical protein
MYKVVAKVLSEHLKHVLDDIIAITQNAFIPHRQILDGVVVINEVLDYINKKRKVAMF